MAKIGDLLAAGPTRSFEFFPPKTDEAEAQLRATLATLSELHPSFVSVTYGAGGTTRDRTRDIVVGIEHDLGLTAMAHLTCISHTRAQIASLLAEYAAAGITNILALAGDPPLDPDAPVGEFTYAAELVELVRASGDVSIGVAAHPELHPRSGGDRVADRRHLADKLALADFGVTQFFFDAEHYLRMCDELAALGCTKPVVPGIMPVTNVASVARMAAMSGASFSEDFLARLHAADGDADEVRKVGVDHATTLCQVLLDAGAPGLHLYTLNRPTATIEIFENLGLTG